ncbi:hypothetical protein Z968_09790 [Clostridium novyi A str. 4552]|uniref:Alcohol dehydrogenase iron-type/glycerol dehydrogenase GldA domain-containing protein n=1 Tax=Clostridium novyi A str. 4552 TaxID=1444289 RepID=A0A0A0I4F2_CLONO|nr:hypothetical protein [Clostridium novyi]KGM95181.1 hypothetical protein Z968_09790 [Clostridium novyi A str. 4552]
MIKSLIAPSKYVQGSGIWSQIHKYIPSTKRNIFMLVDVFIFEKAKKTICKSFEENDFKYTIHKFGGESSTKEVERITKGSGSIMF